MRGTVNRAPLCFCGGGFSIGPGNFLSSARSGGTEIVGSGRRGTNRRGGARRHLEDFGTRVA